MSYSSPLSLVLEALVAAGCDPQQNGSGYRALCPAHADRKPSLTVGTGPDGRVLLHCHAGCGLHEICDALGLVPRDLFPATDRSPGRQTNPKPSNGESQTFATYEQALAALESKLGERSRIWGYHDAEGELVGVIARWDWPNGQKEIRPVSRLADGRWVVGAMPTPRPLFDLPAVLKKPEELVFVTEGEKCAEKLSRLGLIATTSAGGAKAAGKTDWTPLRGRRCVLIPDNDNAGIGYVQDVARLIAAAGGETRTLKLWEFCPSLPAGGDVVDVLSDPDWRGLGLGDSATDEDFANWLRQKAGELFAKPSTDTDPVDGPGLVERAPFPLEALPEVLKDYVQNVSEAIGCDPSYVALPALVACGAALGNTRRLIIKHGWFVPPILWGVIVGESGTHKSPALRAALEGTRKVQTEYQKLYDKRLADWEAARQEWELTKPPRDDVEAVKQWQRREPKRPEPEQQIVDDTTLEALAVVLMHNPRGVLLARDELAGWIRSFDRYVKHGGGDEPRWLSCYHADPLLINRKTGEYRVIRVPRASVGIVGGIQPGVLKRVLGSQHRESGLAARLLMVYPPRKPRQWNDAEVNPEVEERFKRLVESLYSIPLDVDEGGTAKPKFVRLTAEARAEFIRFYNQNANEQIDLEGDLCSAWSKLEEVAARLALTLHYVQILDASCPDPDQPDPDSDPDKTEPRPVSLATMRAAIRLTDWFKQEAKRVYGVLGETDAESGERKLVEFLQRRGGTATAREVQRGCGWLKDPGKAEEALEQLAKRGWGTWEPFATPAGGGRPTRRFTLKTATTSFDKTPQNTPSVSTKLKKVPVSEGFVESRNVDRQNHETHNLPLEGGSKPPLATWGTPTRQPEEPPRSGGEPPGADEKPFVTDESGFNAEPWFGFL